jgi:hypothetical protein
LLPGFFLFRFVQLVHSPEFYTPGRGKTRPRLYNAFSL